MAADEQGNIYIGGQFSEVNDGSGYLAVRNIVRWDGHTFHRLGGGISGKVLAIEVDEQGMIYAGGFFRRAYQDEKTHIYAHNIARWDGSGWSPMGSPGENRNGTDQQVSDIRVAGDRVFVAGQFTHVRRMDATPLKVNHIAQWRQSDWFEMDGGTDAGVESLDFCGGELYVAGNFKKAGEQSAHAIARWNDSGWSALSVDPGEMAAVHTIACGPGNHLYAGGSFMMIGGVFAFNIAKFNGAQWLPMQEGIGFTGSRVNRIRADETGVYAGGYQFKKIGDLEVNHIARWDGNRWHALENGICGGLSVIWDMALVDGDLYAGGIFSVAGRVSAGNIAQWDGDKWSAMGYGENMGPDSMVRAIGAASHGIYVGGGFTTVGNSRISNFARWDGESWHEAGDGVFGPVEVISVHEDLVYVGGNFTRAGDIQTGRLAIWDGINWHAVGGGVNGKVRAIAVNEQGEVYVGGDFNRAINSDGSSVAALHIAKWDGESWHSLDSGVNARVLALQAEGNDLYAGGLFSAASGKTVNFIARWDGNRWHDMAGGMNMTVTSLASDGSGRIYAGGLFSVAGGRAVSFIAGWDGEQWYDLHGGVSGIVYALEWENGTLYSAGLLDTYYNIARWRHGRWSFLPGGVRLGQEPGMVLSLAAAGETVFIGGQFIEAGGIPSCHFASWTDREPDRYDLLMFSRVPRRGMAVLTDRSFELNWTHAPAVEQLSLEIRYGDESMAWQVLEDSLPAAPGQHTVHFTDRPHDEVYLALIDRSNPEIYDIRGPFSLYRADEISRRLRVKQEDGLYDVFKRRDHAWSFANSHDPVWPFDKRFPDWDLYCRAMGERHCYNLLGVPRPWALSIWGIMKGFDWQGSCSGFTTTSLMFFNRYYSVPASFPGREALYDVEVNPAARDMININQIRFLHPVAEDVLRQRLQVWNDKPVTTLEKLEQMLDRQLDHPGLVIMDPSWRKIMRIHTVLPVRVQRDPANTLARIRLYENQTPARYQEIQVDIIKNTWSYTRYEVDDARMGMFLSPGLSLFLGFEESRKTEEDSGAFPLVQQNAYGPADKKSAGMGGRMAAASRLEGGQTGIDTGTGTAEASTHMMIYSDPYTDVLIENRHGEKLGRMPDGDWVHTLDESIPVLSMHPDAEVTRPLGYYIPVDDYQIVRHRNEPLPEGEAEQLSLISGNRLFIYRNMAPKVQQTERIRFQDGLSVVNPDPVAKDTRWELLAKDDERQRQYVISELELMPGDSIHFSIREDMSIELLNIGKAKQYDLSILDVAQEEPRIRVDFSGLDITPNARYRFETGRDLFRMDSLRILIDTNLYGFFNDSLRVIGVITSAAEERDPGSQDQMAGYTLYQNYPNPFNSATRIPFNLPERSSVVVRVYNMLGQSVAVLQRDEMPAGRHHVVFDASHLPSGVYIYSIRAGSFTDQRKMLLLR